MTKKSITGVRQEVLICHLTYIKGTKNWASVVTEKEEGVDFVVELQ